MSIRIRATEVTPGTLIDNPSAFAVKGCFGPVSFVVQSVATVVRTRRIQITGDGHTLTVARDRVITVR